MKFTTIFVLITGILGGGLLAVASPAPPGGESDLAPNDTASAAQPPVANLPAPGTTNATSTSTDNSDLANMSPLRRMAEEHRLRKLLGEGSVFGGKGRGRGRLDEATRARYQERLDLLYKMRPKTKYSEEYDCYWSGTAPFCNGSCPKPYVATRNSGAGDGFGCVTGQKKYCCKIREVEVSKEEEEEEGA